MTRVRPNRLDADVGRNAQLAHRSAVLINATSTMLEANFGLDNSESPGWCSLEREFHVENGLKNGSDAPHYNWFAFISRRPFERHNSSFNQTACFLTLTHTLSEQEEKYVCVRVCACSNLCICRDTACPCVCIHTSLKIKFIFIPIYSNSHIHNILQVYI